MMTQKRKRYDRQFKIAAAQVVPSGDMTVRELSEELQIKDSTLRRWAQEYEAMGDGAFPGNGSPRINKDYEIVNPRKKIDELESAPFSLTGCYAASAAFFDILAS